MTFEIFWEPAAVNSAAAFLEDDPEGLRLLISALDGLASAPRSDNSSPLGSEDQRRIRVGRYRAIYMIGKTQITISVIGRAK